MAKKIIGKRGFHVGYVRVQGAGGVSPESVRSGGRRAVRSDKMQSQPHIRKW